MDSWDSKLQFLKYNYRSTISRKSVSLKKPFSDPLSGAADCHRRATEMIRAFLESLHIDQQHIQKWCNFVHSLRFQRRKKVLFIVKQECTWETLVGSKACPGMARAGQSVRPALTTIEIRLKKALFQLQAIILQKKELLIPRRKEWLYLFKNVQIKIQKGVNRGVPGKQCKCVEDENTSLASCGRRTEKKSLTCKHSTSQKESDENHRDNTLPLYYDCFALLVTI